MIAAGIATVACTISVESMFGQDVADQDAHVARAVRDRGAHVVLLAQRERLAARDADQRRRGADAERDRRVRQRRPEDRGEPDREDQEREGEQHVGRRARSPRRPSRGSSRR